MTRQYTDTVLILGSGPNAGVAAQWPKEHFDRIVVINNAWRVRPDWDDLVYPEDFATSRRPPTRAAHQRFIEADAFVPAQNSFGGFIFGGSTMAFTAAYWALAQLRPKRMAFMGCDLVYPKTGNTHFYGKGTADPLRGCISLRDLGAKSARLGVIAAHEGCDCVNLSEDESALLFPRTTFAALRAPFRERPMNAECGTLRAREASLGYETPSGRFRENDAKYDTDALDDLDRGWRNAYAKAQNRG